MKLKPIIITLFLAVLLLEGVNVYLSNKVAGTSIEVARLTQGVQVLDEQNTSLKSELLSFSSLEHIASRAAELGFTDNKDSAIMLSTPLQVAISR
ncbi:MAG: hypothetical protein ACHQT7_01085 [Candidatus Levyibacteriota bacterium]